LPRQAHIPAGPSAPRTPLPDDPAAAVEAPPRTKAATEVAARTAPSRVQPAPERPEPSPRRSGPRRTGEGCLLGVDIGTTGTKAIAFTPDGQPVARGYADYPLHAGEGGVAECDAVAVLDAVRFAIRQATAEAARSGAGPVLALAAAAQGEAFVPVDAQFRPLRRAILTFDRRGEDGRAELAASGWEGRTEQAGLPLSWIVTAAKLAWLRRHEPDLYRRAAAFLCFEDLLVAHLAGRPVISDSLAQRTWLLDRRARRWEPEALAALELAGRVADVAPAGEVVGEVGPESAKALGLTPGCKVVAGAHDQTAALLGAGAILPGMAAHSIGTVDCMSLTLRDGPAAPFCARGYGLGLHPLPGLAVTLAFGFGGGSLLAWAKAVMGVADVAALLAEVPEAPGEAFAVPFWAGSGTPDLDARDKGALFGLTLETGRGELVAALLRGMALETRRNLHVLTELGVEVREIRLVGGGTRDPGWSQLRADVTGRAYTEMAVRDAGCLGAAILAATGAGLYRDIPAACDAMVRPGRRHEPDPARVAFYDRLFPAYLAAVAATRSARPAEGG
jgi:xylulokinase